MQPTPSAVGPPRRPWLFWPALLVSLAVVVAASVTAVAGYADTRGPAGAVRGYFEALQRSDAPGALGFGDVPGGARTLLTSPVLHEQQRVAPIVDLSVGQTLRSGSRATVRVAYSLRFPEGDSRVTTRIAVHEKDGDWRLDAAAVRTRVSLMSAAQRGSVLGRLLPAGDVLAFPGAPPIRFDTPYLALDPDVGIVPGDAAAAYSAARAFAVTVTAAGRAAMQQAVLAAVRGCLSATRPAPTCPLPSARYLPGSVHGTVVGPFSDVSVSLDVTQVGTLDLTAGVPVAATAYRRLDFRNRVIAGHGRVTLSVRAVAAAHAPLAVTWLGT